MCPNVDFYIGQNNGLFYFCPLNPPKHLRFLKIRTVMIMLYSGDLSLTSQPSKKTVTSLDLQHHGSLLFLHHTDNLLIRHPQGKEHNFYQLLTFTLEKQSGLQLFLKSFWDLVNYFCKLDKLLSQSQDKSFTLHLHKFTVYLYLFACPHTLLPQQYEVISICRCDTFKR